MLAKDFRLRPTAIEVETILTRLTAKMSGEPARYLAGRGRRLTVGRRKESADMLASFEEAAAGRGLLLCVTGEPGLGKTTLVESVLEELVASGKKLKCRPRVLFRASGGHRGLSTNSGGAGQSDPG